MKKVLIIGVCGWTPPCLTLASVALEAAESVISLAEELKQYKTIEPTTSKYFGAPRHNYKRR